MLHDDAVGVGAAVAGRDAALVEARLLVGAVVARRAAHRHDLS